MAITSNARAEFTRTNAGTQKMIGFCTVQDNATFSADFRIAKSPVPDTVALQIEPWSGVTLTLAGNSVDFAFAGPTATVSLAGSASVGASGIATLAVLLGGPAQVSVNVCYEDQSDPGVIVALGTPVSVSVSATLGAFTASGSATLPAGTYNVGYCVLNDSASILAGIGLTAGVAVITS